MTCLGGHLDVGDSRNNAEDGSEVSKLGKLEDGDHIKKAGSTQHKVWSRPIAMLYTQNECNIVCQLHFY